MRASVDDQLKQVIDRHELLEFLLFEANSKIRVDDDQQLDQIDAVGAEFVEPSFRNEFCARAAGWFAGGVRGLSFCRS